MHDLIIIGAGPGGYVAAERAGEMGKSVLLIEKSHLGGVCLNQGCIPTKTLLNSAKHYLHALESEKFGVTVSDARFDLGKAMAWKLEVMTKLRKGVAYTLKKSHVEVINGTAELVKATTVKVGDILYEGENIIISTGSSPFVPPIPGVENNAHVMTSTEILNIETMPEKLVVIGGGVIGIEFASFFATFGVEVHVVEMMKEIIPFMDPDITPVIRNAMKNTTFHLEAKVESLKGNQVTFTQHGKQQTLSADIILMAVGRHPNTAGLGFENIGLDYDRRGIKVNEQMQTNLPSVYAVGDVTGKSPLAHSASRMGEVAVNVMFGRRDRMRYNAIPWVTYGIPEAAGCGLTESEAKARGLAVKSSSLPLLVNGRFLAENGNRAPGICKVIVDQKTNVLLGVHMVGGACSEMIFGASAMIEAELRVQDIKEIVFPHPTVSEIIKDTLLSL